MAIITTAEFKTFKGISASTWDTLIGMLIAAAQDEAERWCGRLFDEVADFNEPLSGNGSNKLFLSRTPVSDFSALYAIDDSGTQTLIDSGSYRWTFDGTIVLLPESFGRVSSDQFGIVTDTRWGNQAVFTEGIENYSATYTGGYASGDMPPALKLSMYRYVDTLFQAYKSGGGEGLAYTSERLGDYSYTKAKAGEVFEQFRSLFATFKRDVR